jgi:TolB-like protein/Tfp pilus assembly protein PilF
LSFFQELKRRNVFRVGAAYVVLAWLIAQVTDVFLEPFGAPEWVIKTILLVLLMGLPLALFFAWAFEMTPEGIKKEKDVDRSQSITAQTGRKLDFTIIAILLIALGYFAWDKFLLNSPEDTAPVETVRIEEPVETDTVDEEKSIAVLPFVNMSDDASNEYFSDGISEEILNSLAKVKELKVAGRTSSFAFKGQNQDLRQIGEALGVENILEGSVRKSGNQIRITAQLIQVKDGFHLWSDSYDRELNNIFAIQDEIAEAILKQLKATLLDGEQVVIQTARADSRTYDLYLLAKQRMYERTRLNLESAAELLDQAIAIDPDYAPAYAQRGTVAMLLSETSYGSTPQPQAQAQAKLYLDKALALDEGLAEAWAGMGLYYRGPPERSQEAIEMLEKALSINPGIVNASNWLVLSYWSTNRLTESMALLDAIVERDPLYKPAIGNRTFQLSLMGRFDEARTYLAEVERFMPGDPSLDGDRAWIHFVEGDAVGGLKLMESSLERQPTDRVYKVGVNWGHYLTHQFDAVFDDKWSGFYVRALFNLGRNEEALIKAHEFAAEGGVGALFSLLNATDQPEKLIAYFEERWTDLDSFRQDVGGNGLFGYRVMADIAYAYHKTGNQRRFDEAMAILGLESEKGWSQGNKGGGFQLVKAAYEVMSGNTNQALVHIAGAIDGGVIVSAKISKEYPYFRELDGNPEYEAIQKRMIEHLNREREKLNLEPVST